MRNYRKGVEPNVMIFKSDLEFNQLYCFISILCVSHVCVHRELGDQILTHESMSDDTFGIDLISNSAHIMYLSYVVSILNESRSSDLSTSVVTRNSINKTFNKKKTNKFLNTNSVMQSANSEGAQPSGGRGYSSSSAVNHSDISVKLVTSKGHTLVINFRSVKDLNDFLDSRPSLVGKLE